MKVSARIIRGKGISVKKLGRDRQAHNAGTVIMRSVAFGKSVMGTVVEESERMLMPRAKSGVNFTPDGEVRVVRAVSDWDRAVYVKSLGGYYNPKTRKKVTSAEYVYMVGDKIFYTN